MTISLKDKVAVVTGGTRGIGYAIVRAMVEAGAKVAIWGSRQETADAAVTKIKLEYPDCNVVGMAPKITDSKEVENAMNAVVQKYGTIDILANNAGLAQNLPLESYTDEEQKAVITSWLLAFVPKGAKFDDAHSKRAIMQYNYFIQNGAIGFDKEGKMLIDFGKVTICARQLLYRIITIQMSKNAGMAKEYIDSLAIWTNELKALASKLGTVDKRLNSYLEVPLAKKLLKTLK